MRKIRSVLGTLNLRLMTSYGRMSRSKRTSVPLRPITSVLPAYFIRSGARAGEPHDGDKFGPCQRVWLFDCVTARTALEGFPIGQDNVCFDTCRQRELQFKFRLAFPTHFDITLGRRYGAFGPIELRGKRADLNACEAGLRRAHAEDLLHQLVGRRGGPRVAFAARPARRFPP